jgi:hypothetical protein
MFYCACLGNCDRGVQLLSNAEREGSWDPLSSHVTHLASSPLTGRLWLLNNEGGTVDAYNLLYPDQAHRDITLERNKFPTCH